MRNRRDAKCIRIAEKEVVKGIYYQCFYHIERRIVMFAIWLYDREKKKTDYDYIGELIDVFDYSERKKSLLRQNCVARLLEDDAVRMMIGMFGGLM